MKKLLVTVVITAGMIFAGYHMMMATADTNDNKFIEQEGSTSYDEITTPEEITEQASEVESMSEDESVTDEEPTTEEVTTVDYEIIDDVYKVKNGKLIEYLGSKKDKKVTKLTIPAAIKKIKKNVFDGYKYIKKVKFAKGSELTSIGNYAFKNCKSLTKITLPAGLKKIGYKAFGGCAALGTITIPASVTSGDTIFGKTSGVTTVKFASGTKIIPANILKYAHSVETVGVKSGVTTIGRKAFFHCSALNSIKLPNSVIAINSSAFSGCSSLESFTMPSNIKTLEKSAFQNCSLLKSIVLRKSLTYMGSNIFANDKNLVLKVYANSVGKAYARNNKLAWEFTPSEIKRRARNKEIYNQFKSLIGEKDAKKYQLKYLSSYVPQGVSVIGKYLVVSMYSNGLKYHSILLVYNYKTGAFLKKVILPSRDHVGSLANVKGRLVVGLNNISTTDYVAVINYARLKKTKNGKSVKYNYVRKLSGYADFAGFDGKIYWAGHSANISYPSMYGYKVKVKKKKLVFVKKYSYVVPANTQGVAIKKGKGGNRTFIFTASLGRLPNSRLLEYRTNIRKSISLGKAILKKILPAMAEGICMGKKGNLLVGFESAAALYCGNPDYTSEIQIKNIKKILYSKLKLLISE